MYKVMLVEDDEVVRYVYSKMKAWARYGFFIQAEAANGKRALEELKNNPVDVVFTDIRMPLMNGIELMQEAIPLYPDIRFVLISSYNEFEYAREGLRLGAVDYIVKPMREEDLDDVLQRVREQIPASGNNLISGMITDIFQDEARQNDPLIRQVMECLNEYKGQNLTIEEVADSLGMNKDYLGRLLKKKTQMSFRSLFNRVKMEYAKPMIKSGQYKIYEISEMLGYTSPDYFSGLFKNIVKMTPVEYKKQSNDVGKV